MKINSKAQQILETLDSEILSNMVKLYQKLKGLSAEINVSLENPFVVDEEFREEYLEKLSTVSQGIDTALTGIEEMLNLIASQDEATNKEFLAGDIMQQYKKSLVTRLSEIQNMKIEL